LIWGLRAGYLVTSVISALPLWRSLDLLPILDHEEKSAKDRPLPAADEESRRDESKLDAMLT
jgi:hypothetical protein